MLISALAALLVLSSPQQSPPQQSSPPPQDPAAAVDLEDIVVEGRRLEDLTRDFVNEVSAPAFDRGMARWRNGVCVGVANLGSEAAQYIADRVSTVAQDVGLRAGGPGCSPSIMIIATANASAFAEAYVDRRPTLFRVGGTGMDQGRSGLRRFVTTQAPVRWWNVSLPVDSETGQPAIRMPGQFDPSDGKPTGATINTTASRLRTQVVDDSKRAFVIIDVDKVGGVSLAQLADYIAFVALAQVNPEADTSGYATILNVFNDPEQTSSLTNWDRAYLQGLYDTVRTRKNPRSQQGEVASSIVRANRELRAQGDVDNP